MNITIFGSGTIQEKSRGWKTAYETGFFLARAGFTVVNGGYGGTMAAAAQGAKDGGGKTIGVTTEDFPGAVKNLFIDQEVRMKHWQDRLFKLIELGNGFVVLDGAMGTLVELVMICEMMNRGFLSKPVVVIGRRMQSAACFMRRLPEVRFSKELLFKTSPKAAVQCLKERLFPVR